MAGAICPPVVPNPSPCVQHRLRGMVPAFPARYVPNANGNSLAVAPDDLGGCSRVGSGHVDCPHLVRHRPLATIFGARRHRLGGLPPNAATCPILLE